MSNSEDFKFDFALDKVAADWQREDLEEPDGNEFVERRDSDGTCDSVHSFFETQFRGNAYFTITDPEKVKQEWITNRRAVKLDIQNEMKMLLRKKMRHEK